MSPQGISITRLQKAFFELIQQLNQEQNIAFLLVTHDMGLAEKLSRRLVMQDGIFEGRCIMNTPFFY